MRENSFPHLLCSGGNIIKSSGCKEGGGSSLPICPLQGANADFKVAGKKSSTFSKAEKQQLSVENRKPDLNKSNQIVGTLNRMAANVIKMKRFKAH